MNANDIPDAYANDIINALSSKFEGIEDRLIGKTVSHIIYHDAQKNPSEYKFNPTVGSMLFEDGMFNDLSSIIQYGPIAGCIDFSAEHEKDWIVKPDTP